VVRPGRLSRRDRRARLIGPGSSASSPTTRQRSRTPSFPGLPRYPLRPVLSRLAPPWPRGRSDRIGERTLTGVGANPLATLANARQCPRRVEPYGSFEVSSNPGLPAPAVRAGGFGGGLPTVCQPAHAAAPTAAEGFSGRECSYRVRSRSMAMRTPSGFLSSASKAPPTESASRAMSRHARASARSSSSMCSTMGILWKTARSPGGEAIPDRRHPHHVLAIHHRLHLPAAVRSR
jgi:hypothetical protein